MQNTIANNALIKKLFGWSSTRKLQNAMTFSVVLFLFRLVFPDSLSFNPLFVAVSEVLVLMTFYFITLYVQNFIRDKKHSPLSIILNAGILNALIFFILSVISPVFNEIFGQPGGNNGNFLYSIAAIFLSFLFIVAMAYNFSVFRSLFFLKQKRNPSFYFNTMTGFFIAASLAGTVSFLHVEFSDFKTALFIVSILLITLNSIRTSWIAFLTKKEKMYLLIISVVMSILFGVNIGLSNSGNLFVTQALTQFSPALHEFLVLMMSYGCIYFSVVFFTTLFHMPTAEAFDRKAQEVSSLMDLSRLMTQVFDFKELAETVTDITMKVCNSDSAWLVSGENGELNLNAVKNIGYIEADKITAALSRMYGLKNIKNVKTISLDKLKPAEAASLDNPSSAESLSTDFRLLAVSPLKVHNEVNGYLIAARKSEDPFDDDDQKSIAAFADYAAVAIENAKLLAESLEKERMEKELDVAREIQYKILPDKTPEIENMQVSALFVPAFEVGGDYYDFFRLDSERLGFVIADVSGKGIPAAFIMAEVKGIFESLARLIESPREVLVKANEVLRSSLDKKSFVTVVYGVIGIKTGTVFFSRAGHSPVILLRQGLIQELKPCGMGLGLDFSSNFSNSLEEVEIKLKENDILLLYTDGIPESKNAQLEDFGYERFNRIILDNAEAPIDLISKRIMKEVAVFSQGKPQHDDITLVIFKWTK